MNYQKIVVIRCISAPYIYRLVISKRHTPRVALSLLASISGTRKIFRRRIQDRAHSFYMSLLASIISERESRAPHRVCSIFFQLRRICCIDVWPDSDFTTCLTRGWAKKDLRRDLFDFDSGENRSQSTILCNKETSFIKRERAYIYLQTIYIHKIYRS